MTESFIPLPLLSPSPLHRITTSLFPPPSYHEVSYPSPISSSHHTFAQMRTPLNAATLGLNMLATQLKKKKNPTPADLDLCESIGDIQLACSTAVDILNDLLSFEKLESGILVLNRQDISAPKFLMEGVVMFSAQVWQHQLLSYHYIIILHLLSYTISISHNLLTS